MISILGKKEDLGMQDGTYLVQPMEVLARQKSLANIKSIPILKLNKNQYPIFVSGSARSGTTLLHSLIAANSQIGNCYNETNAFTSNDDPLICYYYLLYRRTLLCLQRKKTAIRWVEKTPKHCRHIDKIHKLFKSKVKFVFIIRDGRQVCTSKHKRFKPTEYTTTPNRWIKESGYILKALEDYPNDTLLIRYEGLVKNPNDTVDSVFNF